MSKSPPKRRIYILHSLRGGQGPSILLVAVREKNTCGEDAEHLIFNNLIYHEEMHEVPVEILLRRNGKCFVKKGVVVCF